MNILTTEYSLKHKALEVYLAGCRTHCPGCHNPESWDFKQGKDWKKRLPSLEKKLRESLVQCVWILGGEPLDQEHEELRSFLTWLRNFDKDVWLFTSRELDEIPHDIITLCAFIKTGKYVEALRSDTHFKHGVKLSTTNQNIWKIN